MKCILIETNDKRQFFTHKKNLIQLNDFLKTFNSKAFIVELEKGEILELDQLASALCSVGNKKIENTYKIIEQIKKTEKNNLSGKIKDFIVTELVNKKPMSIKKIKSKFKKYDISEVTLYNYFKKTKLELEKKGYEFSKIKTGVYKRSN